jgi:hypothetical protein
MRHGYGGLDFWFLQVRVVGSRVRALKPGWSDMQGWSMPYGHWEVLEFVVNLFGGALQRKHKSHKQEGEAWQFSLLQRTRPPWS